MTCSSHSSDDSCGDAECSQDVKALEAAVNEPDAECACALRAPSMPADTDTPDIVEYEHVDPEQVAEKEQAASQAETDASLVKQAAVSKFQAAHCRGGLGAPS